MSDRVTKRQVTSWWTNCNMSVHHGAMEYDEDIDALGLLCPLPVLKAAKRIRAMAPGAVLRLRADDPAAVVDVPHYCAQHGHAFLGEEKADGTPAFFIRKSD